MYNTEMVIKPNKIKELREQAGMKQYELAAIAGITTQYLSKLEKGKGKRPGVAVITSIARSLNATVAELFPHHGYSVKENHQPVMARQKQSKLLREVIVEIERQIIKANLIITPEKKAGIITMIYEEASEGRSLTDILKLKISHLISLAQ